MAGCLTIRAISRPHSVSSGWVVVTSRGNALSLSNQMDNCSGQRVWHMSFKTLQTDSPLVWPYWTWSHSPHSRRDSDELNLRPLSEILMMFGSWCALAVFMQLHRHKFCAKQRQPTPDTRQPVSSLGRKGMPFFVRRSLSLPTSMYPFFSSSSTWWIQTTPVNIVMWYCSLILQSIKTLIIFVCAKK